jgi:hypothetical protein
MTGIGWAVEFVALLVGQLLVTGEPEELPDDEEASAEPPDDDVPPEEPPDDDVPPEEPPDDGEGPEDDGEPPEEIPDDEEGPEEEPPDDEPSDSGPPGVEEGLELLEHLLRMSSSPNERPETVLGNRIVRQA